jgi:asparagine synthase (glutamine-hydrolysing)
MWDAPELGVVELSRMLSSLSHRGPDERGMVVLGDGRALGHQRLSIVDIEGGHQPFVREPGPAATGPTRCLVANGEIYNAGPLRTDLADAPFTTDSDNEVILHLLDAGAGEVGRLRGMYAFALADGDDLVLGRDPLATSRSTSAPSARAWCSPPSSRPCRPGPIGSGR